MTQQEQIDIVNQKLDLGECVSNADVELDAYQFYELLDKIEDERATREEA